MHNRGTHQPAQESTHEQGRRPTCPVWGLRRQSGRFQTV